MSLSVAAIGTAVIAATVVISAVAMYLGGGREALRRGYPRLLVLALALVGTVPLLAFFLDRVGPVGVGVVLLPMNVVAIVLLLRNTAPAGPTSRTPRTFWLVAGTWAAVLVAAVIIAALART
jgi:hypothetical protein